MRNSLSEPKVVKNLRAQGQEKTSQETDCGIIMILAQLEKKLL